MGNYFDYTTGEFGFNMGDDSMLMNQDGDLLMRTSDTSAIDLETGELHIISSFDDDEE
ncbi:MAG: hypothetical protein SOY46_07285 [Butyrivibrio crossotus]|nr:hypothetical protein [Butyrivibrio crossotus]